MAITFSKDISTTHLLNAYNDNIVKFTSNAIPVGETIVKCKITIAGNEFEITPNTSNVFSYNLKNAFKVLSDNKFIDNVALTNYTALDTNLIKSFTIDFLITFSGGGTETISRSVKVLKKVEQIGGFTSTPYTGTKLLNHNKLTFFRDYPFGISIYSGSNFTLTNNTTGESLNVTSNNQVTRIVVSNINFFARVIADGGIVEDSGCYDNLYWVQRGYNEISTGSETFTINQVDKCGVYLKWFDVSRGCYSYWLFSPIYKEVLNTKTLDTYKIEFDGVNTELITGKGEYTERKLTSDSLTFDEFETVKTVLSSPKVELWNGTQFQSVLLTDGTFDIENTKKDFYKVNISIRLNKYSY